MKYRIICYKWYALGYHFLFGSEISKSNISNYKNLDNLEPAAVINKLQGVRGFRDFVFRDFVIVIFNII